MSLDPEICYAALRRKRSRRRLLSGCAHDRRILPADLSGRRRSARTVSSSPMPGRRCSRLIALQALPAAGHIRTRSPRWSADSSTRSGTSPTSSGAPRTLTRCTCMLRPRAGSWPRFRHDVRRGRGAPAGAAFKAIWGKRVITADGGRGGYGGLPRKRWPSSTTSAAHWRRPDNPLKPSRGGPDPVFATRAFETTARHHHRPWLLDLAAGARLAARRLALRFRDQPRGRRLQPSAQLGHERLAFEPGLDRGRNSTAIRPGRLMKLRRPQNTPEFSATGTTGHSRCRYSAATPGW